MWLVEIAQGCFAVYVRFEGTVIMLSVCTVAGRNFMGLDDFRG